MWLCMSSQAEDARVAMATTIAARVLLTAIFTAFNDHVDAIERFVKTGVAAPGKSKAKKSKKGDAMDVDGEPAPNAPTQVWLT